MTEVIIAKFILSIISMTPIAIMIYLTCIANFKDSDLYFNLCIIGIVLAISAWLLNE